MIDLYELSEKIKARRKQKKWTQIDLANYAKVSRTFIRKLESGSFADISFVKLCAVLDLLDMSVEINNKPTKQISNGLSDNKIEKLFKLAKIKNRKNSK